MRISSNSDRPLEAYLEEANRMISRFDKSGDFRKTVITLEELKSVGIN